MRRLSLERQRIAQRKLVMIDAAESLEDLRVPPGNRLEKLVGGSNRPALDPVNDRWRICFSWRDGDAYEVEVVDYH